MPGRIDRRAFLLAVVANAIGGATYYATKEALLGLPAVTISLVRTVVALAILLPLAGRAALGALVRADRKTRVQVLVMGIVGYAIPLTLGNFGVGASTATNGALLIGTEPLATVLLAALVLGEAITRPRGIALVFGLLGAVVIVSNGLPFVTDVSTPHLVGDLLLVLHGAMWATWTIAGKKVLGSHGAFAVSGLALGVSLSVLVPASAFELRGFHARPALWPALAWAIALGALVSALGTVLWNAALRRMDASQMAGFIFLQPVVGALLGVLVLDERPTVWTFVGGALVFAGVGALALEGRQGVGGAGASGAGASGAGAGASGTGAAPSDAPGSVTT